MSLHTSLEADFGTVTGLIGEVAQAAPERTALVDGERQLSFGELDRLIDTIAAKLLADGLAPRDAIAICAATSLEYVAVFLGALRAGIAVAPLAPSSTPEALATMAADSGAKLLFLDATTRASLAAIDLPRVSLDDTPPERGFSEWRGRQGARPPAIEIAPDWIFNIIYSSGTTGTPKGIEQSHLMRWFHVRRLGQDAYGPDARTMISTPLYSNTTLVCLFPTLANGGTAILMRKFDARDFLVLAQDHRATHAMLVPVQYSRLMAQPDFDSYDLSSFKLKLSTSAPFSAALKRDILQRWPGALVEYYGMTEGGGACILHAHEFPDKLHTVGQPAPDHDIRLIDEQGREVAQGEAGEVVGRSNSVMNGYHNQPDKTREAEWFDAEGRRYIRTGDIGRFDADGFLTLLDRRKDMIISGGFNIYPSDLEAVLVQNDAVEEASVVGIDSAAWGETPVAFVVAKPGAAPDAEALREWVNARVGKTQRLSALRLVESLPRSAIGKVLKRELREAFDGKVA
ncbi:MAG: class I adenylate-forming enzyme family protein [Beijerinckiaceae bacterium]